LQFNTGGPAKSLVTVAACEPVRWYERCSGFQAVSSITDLPPLTPVAQPTTRRGLLAHAEGRHRDALDFLRKAQARAPRSGLVRWHIAEVLLALGRTPEAKRELTSAAHLEPNGELAEIVALRLTAVSSL
jgi:tetratricopeptide (TPR) repeat protein